MNSRFWLSREGRLLSAHAQLYHIGCMNFLKRVELLFQSHDFDDDSNDDDDDDDDDDNDVVEFTCPSEADLGVAAVAVVAVRALQCMSHLKLAPHPL